MIYALVKDGVVENVVVWDGEGNLFPDYLSVILPDGAGIGWLYADGAFSPPTESGDEITQEEQTS